MRIITLICAMLFASISYANEIEGAFGIKLGDDVSNYSEQIIYDNEDAFLIDIGFMDFDKAYVYYTPKTKKIRSIATFVYEDNCNKAETISAILEKKYGPNQNLMEDLIYSRKSGNNFVYLECKSKFEVVDHKVYSKKLIISVMDITLENQGKKEKIEITKEKEINNI